MTSKLITLTTKEDIELLCSAYNAKDPSIELKQELLDNDGMILLQVIEDVVQQKIEFLVAQHDPIATKLEVLKELFLEHRTNDGQAYVTAIRNIRTLTKCSLKNARTIVDSWVKEIEDNTYV